MSHLTVTCDHRFARLFSPEDDEFISLLHVIVAACAASEELLRRLDWWRPPNEWKAFEINEDPRTDVRYVEVTPRWVLTLAPRALRFHTGVSMEQFQRDEDYCAQVRRYFEVISRRAGDGSVLYSTCGGSIRDEITEWAIGGLTRDEICDRLASQYGIRPRSVVRRRESRRVVPHTLKSQELGGNHERQELWVDWFEDLRAPADVLGARRAGITSRWSRRRMVN